MKKIVLISCVKSKADHAAKARDLYTSLWFRLALRYAEMMKPDEVFVLSAKYGLLNLDVVVEPYEKTLKTMPMHEIESWAAKVVGQLRACADLERDHFIFLASDEYRKYIVPHVRSFEVPMQGLAIGKQRQFLKGQVGA